MFSKPLKSPNEIFAASITNARAAISKEGVTREE